MSLEERHATEKELLLFYLFHPFELLKKKKKTTKVDSLSDRSQTAFEEARGLKRRWKPLYPDL